MVSSFIMSFFKLRTAFCFWGLPVNVLFSAVKGSIGFVAVMASLGFVVILFTVLIISFLKAIRVTASNGNMNINFSKCIFADFARFIMMIRFFKDEKLNWLAMRYCGIPTTFNK